MGDEGSLTVPGVQQDLLINGLAPREGAPPNSLPQPGAPNPRTPNAEGRRLTPAPYQLYKKPTEYKVLKECVGKDLHGLKYAPLFPYFEELKGETAFRVLVDEYVTADSGVGIVHQARTLNPKPVVFRSVTLNAQARGAGAGVWRGRLPKP